MSAQQYGVGGLEKESKTTTKTKPMKRSRAEPDTAEERNEPAIVEKFEHAVIRHPSTSKVTVYKGRARDMTHDPNIVYTPN